MVVQVAAADFILTTIGRVAVRPLAGYLAKNGGKKFAQQYGPKAFEAVLGTTVGLKAYKETEEYLSEYLNHIDEGGEEGSFVPKGSMPDTDRMKQMDSMMAVPNVNPNINRSIRGTPAGLVIGDTGQKEKERERIAAEEKERMKGAPAPKVETGWKESFPDQSGELIDSSLPPSTPEPIELPQESFPDLSDEANKPQIFFNKKDDVKKQTDKLVPEKVELGPLSAVEKQTALALKGNKPDFYSRAVEAITNAKQDKSTKGKWKSIVQSNSTKEEIKYLGLDKYLQGNESITKQELLDFVDQKNIADKLSVVEVPLEDQFDFLQYSIGGAGSKRSALMQESGGWKLRDNKTGYKSTVEQYVFQVGGVDIGMADTAHFPEKYAKDTIAHARAQTGYFDADAVEKRLDLKEADGEKLTNNDKVLKNASRQLEDTFIIDEIQSDMIQKIQKKGIFEDHTVVNNKNIIEYLDKNNIEYTIYNQDLPIEREFKSEDSPLLLKGSNVIELKNTTGYSDSRKIPINVENRFEIFTKDGRHGESVLNMDNLEDAKNYLKESGTYGAPNLPITESKKYVELVLNAMIKKAVEKNLDSIGITNGQIQYDRYTGQPIKDKEGLKKFYDEIVYKQLEKVADKYNVKLETVKLPGKAGPKEFDDVGLSEPTESGDGAAITRRASRAIRNGFVLRKISGNLLASTLDDLIQGRFEDPERANHPGAVLPDYTSILTDTGAASGDMVLENLIEDSADTDGDKDYYIWVAPNTPIDNAIQAGTDRYSSLSGIWDIRDINLQMPISPAIQTEGADFVQTIREIEGRDLTDYLDEYEHSPNNLVDVNNYNNYINNFYNKKNFDIGYSHEIIKMPLPKKLQKDILSKPIKLSKLKTQTDRLTA
jgi:hypothetical protein